jgi:hypothetical protein
MIELGGGAPTTRCAAPEQMLGAIVVNRPNKRRSLPELPS